MSSFNVTQVYSMSPKCNPSVIHTSPNDLHVPRMIWVALNGFGVLPLNNLFIHIQNNLLSTTSWNLNKYKYNNSYKVSTMLSLDLEGCWVNIPQGLNWTQWFAIKDVSRCSNKPTIQSGKTTICNQICSTMFSYPQPTMICNQMVQWTNNTIWRDNNL